MVVRMGIRRIGHFFVLMFCTLAAAPVTAQELGHKLLGGVGMSAGVQPEPGLHILDRLVSYGADEVRDRNGNAIPIVGLDVDAIANVIGVAYTRRLAAGPFYSAALGLPLARLSVDVDHPFITLEDAGFGDVFVQPLKLGFRYPAFDVVGSYAFYAPTGHFEPEGASVGRGYWTHEFSLGGALRPTPVWRASMLASFDVNTKKRDIAVTRGNTIQIQGGAGATLRQAVHLGVAGFALWQVTDNSGSDLPDIAREARTRVFGLGPEVGVTIPSIRTRVDARYAWEFGVRSRQAGSIFVLSASFLARWPAAFPPARPQPPSS
jgi:hypothetical protein